MKKVLLTLVSVALVISCMFALVACNRELPSEVSIENYGNAAPVDSVVGTNIKPVTSAMAKDARAMFLNAVDNFYKSEYSSVLLLGKVVTDVKISKVTQMVECLRLHDGDDVFMYNNSFTKEGPSFVDIKVMEKYFIDGKTGEYTILSADAKSVKIAPSANDPEHKILKADKWSIYEEYKDHDAYLAKYDNDPSLLNMYELNEKIIKRIVKSPKHVTAEEAGQPMGYYEFNIEKTDAKRSFSDNGYIKVMEYMLNQSVPGNVNMDKPMKLLFDKVQIWENGLFKSYTVTEGYSVKAAGIIDGDIDLVSEVKFSYDRAETPMEKFFDKSKTGQERFVYDAVAVE